MGQEFAQGHEWNADSGLDWPLLDMDGTAACRRRARLQSPIARTVH
jgi:1,4-alpha-glucan branching enzyme